MSNKLTWKNPNTLADSIVIYRSTSKIDKSALPAPLATLAKTEVEYIDTTNLLNVPYYYRIGRVSGLDIALSPNICLQERSELGAGPTTLLRGDFETGYFGSVSAADFFTTAELTTAVGLSTANSSIVEANPTWHKFAHNGKIKYLPNKVLRVGTGINFFSLYNLGAAFGTDTTASELIQWNSSPAVTPKVQDKRVTRDNRTYRVRLLQFLKPGVVVTTGYNIEAYHEQGKGSEFQQLINKMVYDSNAGGALAWHNEPRLLNLLASDILSNNRAISCSFCQLNMCFSFTQGSRLMTVDSPNVSSGSSAWYPVLELDE